MYISFFPCFIEYPKELHDEHSDYPLAPERIQVTPKMLSPKQLEMLGATSFKDVKQSCIKKLIPNLNNKEKYILHYRNLQLYLKLGMKLQKVNKDVFLNLNTITFNKSVNEIRILFYYYFLLSGNIFIELSLGRTTKNLSIFHTLNFNFFLLDTPGSHFPAKLLVKALH